jgi:hypothetical protein
MRSLLFVESFDLRPNYQYILLKAIPSCFRLVKICLCQVSLLSRCSPRYLTNHTLLSHLRLRQPGGPGSCIYIPQEQGGPVIPPGTTFPLSLTTRLLWLAGLWKRHSNPPRIYILQEQDGPVKSQSHIATDGQSIGMSWCLVHSELKGFHPNEFQSDIRRSTLRRNVLCYPWEGCM